MSKEMLIIVLGVWTVILTQLGIPYHPYGVLLFVITGAAIAVTGFLLRGEALSRHHGHSGAPSSRTTFVESSAPTPAHEHKEGITSLN
jgi:hypothetical protein